MCRLTNTLCFALAATLTLLTTSAAASPIYTYTVLVEAGQTIDGLTLRGVESFARNDSGMLVFTSVFAGAGGPARGIFTPDRLIAAQGSTIGGRTLIGNQISFYSSLNDRGTAVFSATYAGGSGIFTQDSLLAGTGSTIGGRTLIGVGFPSINDNGAVAFTGSFLDNGVPKSGIFTPDALLVAPGQVINGRMLSSYVSGSTINNSGTVAFFDSQGLFTQTSLLVAQGTVIGNLTLGDFGTKPVPVLNDQGTAGFVGTYRNANGNGGSAVFTQNAVLAQPGSVIDGKRVVSPPEGGLVDINDVGTAVFDVFYEAGSVRTSGIFTQEGLVVSAGQTIGGRTLSSVSSPHINNLGEIAFSAGFIGGGSGILLATPDSSAPGIPEPTTWALLGGGLLGLIAYRRSAQLAKH